MFSSLAISEKKIVILRIVAMVSIQRENAEFRSVAVILCGLLLVNIELHKSFVFADEDCLSNSGKETFPNLDYALFGYNIYHGYPLATGHDPGFTRPIFKHDYRGRNQTADCRYSVPKGYIVVPDVSCVTSFTSETIRNSTQLSKSLAAHVEVSGGGWGAKFSASADYKKTNSELSSGESVFIHSKAKCDYYYAILDDLKPPSFTASFLKFIINMRKSNESVFDLFDLYGTHFLERVTFGARFMYENKMKSEDYSNMNSESFSVEAQASYSGAFDLGGGFGLTNQQNEAAQSFSNKAETKTISVGAPPPANGDTMTWASTVKENPIPSKYNLIPIKDLFTDKYMNGVSLTTSYTDLHDAINNEEVKSMYCWSRLLPRGEVDFCGNDTDFVEPDLNFGLIKVVGEGEYDSLPAANFEHCTQLCISMSSVENGLCIHVMKDTRKGCKFYCYKRSNFPIGRNLQFGGRSSQIPLASKIFINRLIGLGKKVTFQGLDVVFGEYLLAEHSNVEGIDQCEEKCSAVDCKVLNFNAHQKSCRLFYYFPKIGQNNVNWSENSVLIIAGNKS